MKATQTWPGYVPTRPGCLSARLGCSPIRPECLPTRLGCSPTRPESNLTRQGVLLIQTQILPTSWPGVLPPTRTWTVPRETWMFSMLNDRHWILKVASTERSLYDDISLDCINPPSWRSRVLPRYWHTPDSTRSSITLFLWCCALKKRKYRPLPSQSAIFQNSPDLLILTCSSVRSFALKWPCHEIFFP
jgi:hypothetical protein